MAIDRNSTLRFFAFLVSIFALMLFAIFAVKYAYLFAPDAPGLIIGFLCIAGSGGVGFCTSLIILRKQLRGAEPTAERTDEGYFVERLALFMTLSASFSFIALTMVCLLGGFNIARLR